MRQSEKQDLKKNIKRLGLFLLIVFLPVLVVGVVLATYIKQQWVSILVLVVLLFLLWFLYLFVCSKLDQRKEKRKQNKKDPFSE